VTMKILHTADIHIRTFEDERWETLSHLLETARKQGVGLFAVSGDLFDRDMDADRLRPRIRELFTDNGFPVLLLPGNHDREAYGQDLYFGGDAVILDGSSRPFFDTEKVRVLGLPFEPLEGQALLDRIASLRPLLADDKPNILLCHGELLDSFFSRRDFGEEGTDRYMPFWLWHFEALPVDYVLAGHFHTSFDVRRLKHGGTFVYPGSPVSITRKETGRRKVNLFELGGAPGEWPVDSPHYEAIDILADTSSSRSPLDLLRERLGSLHPQAKALLTVRGVVDSRTLGMTETELQERIRQEAGDRLADLEFQARDIGLLLEDELFQEFKKRLQGKKGWEEARKETVTSLLIRAMIEAGTCS